METTYYIRRTHDHTCIEVIVIIAIIIIVIVTIGIAIIVGLSGLSSSFWLSAISRVKLSRRKSRKDSSRGITYGEDRVGVSSRVVYISGVGRVIQRTKVEAPDGVLHSKR